MSYGAQTPTPLACRLLPFAIANGTANMAADEVLLESAVTGLASLRFYGWSEPTLTLGYFQKEALRLEDPLLRELPYVRRPTGGATLIHDHEVTYALALPAGTPWHKSESWLVRMHRILANALRKLGVDCRICTAEERASPVEPLCFKHFTPGDLLIGQNKIVGSAQRRQRGVLLQHGAMLLNQSVHSPSLPGVFELSQRRLEPNEVIAAVAAEFVKDTTYIMAADNWTASEQERAEELVASKYGQDWWNRKR
jgi:lipoate-protein ligase A